MGVRSAKIMHPVDGGVGTFTSITL